MGGEELLHSLLIKWVAVVGGACILFSASNCVSGGREGGKFALMSGWSAGGVDEVGGLCFFPPWTSILILAGDLSYRPPYLEGLAGKSRGRTFWKVFRNLIQPQRPASGQQTPLSFVISRGVHDYFMFFLCFPKVFMIIS